ncbi:MAG: hypothetical protein WC356_02890 [Candidatus Micrarchaeia archaeon]|jgi:hypothetical protein
MIKEKRQPWNPLLCSYPDSEKVNNVSFEAETLYTRLIAACDDNANYDGKPTLIMCGVFKKRFDAGLIDVPKMGRLRNELIEAGLIKLYKVNGVEYIHIEKCKKHLRKDINPDIRFPQSLAAKEDTKSETETLRARSENSPSNTDTNTDTNTVTSRLAVLLFKKITDRKPDFKKPDLQKWAEHIDKMIRIDNRKPETIEKIIIWCQADCGDGGKWKGWQNNILSTAKLREKFDKLELAMNAKIAPAKTNQPKQCFVDKEPAVVEIKTGVCLCANCKKLFDVAPAPKYFNSQKPMPKHLLSKQQIEDLILKQKAKSQTQNTGKEV